MAVRVTTSRRSPTRERRGRVAAERGRLPRRARSRRASRASARRRSRTSRASSSRRPTTSSPATTSQAARRRPAPGVLPRRWRSVDLAYARSKNLTPYDVLKIASMIEEEAAVPAERPLIAAVIYNRLRDRMPLGIDATLRYGLHIPPTQSITESRAREREPVQHAQVLRAAADADREPRARLDRGRRAPGARSTTSTTCACPAPTATSSSRARRAFDHYLATHGYGPHP